MRVAEDGALMESLEFKAALARMERQARMGDIDQMIRWKVLAIVAPWYCRRVFKRCLSRWCRAFNRSDHEASMAELEKMAQMLGGRNKRKGVVRWD